jgi:hypothetical protein
MGPRGVDLQAEHALIELQGAAQVLHQQADVVQALELNPRCAQASEPELEEAPPRQVCLLL